VADAGAAGLAPCLSPGERIRAAARDLVLAQGYGAPTVEAIVERAGVERAEFESRYADVEDCCLQVFLANIADFDEAILSAFERPGAWRDRVSAAVDAMARFLRDRPDDVRFDAVEMASAGDLPRVHRERQLQRLVELVDLGRRELDDPESMSRHVAEAVVGAIHELVFGEIRAGRAPRAAEDIAPDVIYVVLRPYLSHEAALEELKKQRRTGIAP
jgi:AcrR family transcriptional regulator